MITMMNRHTSSSFKTTGTSTTTMMLILGSLLLSFSTTFVTEGHFINMGNHYHHDHHKESSSSDRSSSSSISSRSSSSSVSSRSRSSRSSVTGHRSNNAAAAHIDSTGQYEVLQGSSHHDKRMRNHDHQDDDDNNNNDPLVTNFTGSRVNVHIPFHLHESTGSMEHMKADFGFTSNNDQGIINAFVYFVDGTLCSPITGTTNRTTNITNQPHPIVYPIPKNNNDNNPSGTYSVFHTPFILLVRSEECSVVTKVRNAQAIGAAAVVIGHDYCRCDDTVCTKKYGPTCVPSLHRYADDTGSSGDITIPSFFIYKLNAEDLFIELKNKNQPVLMELAWGLSPTSHDLIRTEPIYYHLWTTAHDPIMDYETLDAIRFVSNVFSPDEAIFQPMYAIMDGEKFGCTSSPDENGPCDHLCSNGGRYCNVHALQLSGHAILNETLRQLCIHKHYSSIDALVDAKKDGPPVDSNIYWNYIIYHRTHCAGPEEFANIDCIHSAYEAAGIPSDTGLGKHSNHIYSMIDSCMIDAGDMNNDVPNTAFEYQLAKKQEHGIIEVPVLEVNKHKLSKSSPEELFLAICSYYWDSRVPTPNYPKICDTCGDCPNIVGCIDVGHCIPFDHSHPFGDGSSDHRYNGQSKHHHHRHGGGHHGWMWTFVILCILGGGGYYYYVQNNMVCPNPLHYFGIGNNGPYRSDRSGVLNNYFQLSGSGE